MALSKETEKLLREQNFRGKAVAIFSDNSEGLSPFLKKRMADSVSEIGSEEISPCDYCISWLKKEGTSLSFLKRAGKALKGKGKFVFLLKGTEKPPSLESFFSKYGFLVTRQFVLNLPETEGISYSRVFGAKKSPFIFLVAEKLGD